MNNRKRIIAVLDTMWDWRQRTSSAGYTPREAPRYFRINPENHSGKRLYRFVGDHELLVTNACRELAQSANHHGTPNPDWLKENLEILHQEKPIDLILVCGKVAQKTFDQLGFQEPNTVQVMKILHPAARTWSSALIEETIEKVRKICSE
mgnify:FL=1